MNLKYWLFLTSVPSPLVSAWLFSFKHKVILTTFSGILKFTCKVHQAFRSIVVSTPALQVKGQGFKSLPCPQFFFQITFSIESRKVMFFFLRGWKIVLEKSIKVTYNHGDWLKQSQTFLKIVMKSKAQISNLPPNSHRVCRR